MLAKASIPIYTIEIFRNKVLTKGTSLRHMRLSETISWGVSLF